MREEAKHNSIFLVTGQVQGGKTSYLSELTEQLKQRDFKVAGFLAPGSFESVERSEIRLQNILNGFELPMASIRETPGWTRFRRFWFNPEAFRLGQEWITASLKEGPDVIVIDEVGPMELEGSGWSESLEILQHLPSLIQVWSVRESLIKALGKRWNVPSSRMIHIEKTDLALATEMISEMIQRYRVFKY